jgi:alkanesulfonate monooxygenase SsuD/methylene tetrahydromethanopterin reductase-like flavin-dependent oxidoreductase (luciferase family)
LIYSFVGTRQRVKDGVESFLDITQADELIVTGHIYDHAARLHSFEIASGILTELAKS